MDEFKHRAIEKIDAFQTAARTAAGTGSDRVTDTYTQAIEAFKQIAQSIAELFPQDLISQSCDSVTTWARLAIDKIEESAVTLSPIVLYEDLINLWKDAVWRRSILVFISGIVCGISIGVMVGVGWCRNKPSGPHCRALISTYDASVLFVNDHLVPAVGSYEVLVRVQAFSVCPVDRSVLRGRGSSLRSLLYNTHVTVGRGFAGVILDTGAAVSSLELGDEVWGCVSEWSPGAGTELLVVNCSRVSKRPPGLSPDAAASLPWAGVGALGAFNKLAFFKENNNITNKRLCIVGAETSEGCVLTHLASSRSAHVTVAAHKHHHATLLSLGASDAIEFSCTKGRNCWSPLEHQAAISGPWDCVLLCTGTGYPAAGAVLRTSAPRKAMVDLRPHPLITDRLPTPVNILFAASFYSFRAFRWTLGLGTQAEWLEDNFRLNSGLQQLAECVSEGQIRPVLDKVFLPEDFESALAHACSEDAFGATVIRFP